MQADKGSKEKIEASEYAKKNVSGNKYQSERARQKERIRINYQALSEGESERAWENERVKDWGLSQKPYSWRSLGEKKDDDEQAHV